MKLWIAKNSDVPIHDQLVAQIMLGIASSDLTVGERLPSTRELARRFSIHQNTVAAAYRELAARGLIESKKGSGVFVTSLYKNAHDPTLDQLYIRFLTDAAALGHTKVEVMGYIARMISTERTRRFIVVESDSKLREIIVYEVSSQTGIETQGISIDALSSYNEIEGAQLLALSNERPRIEGITDKCQYLIANSVPSAMSGQERPSGDELIAIVSGWEQFLSFAKLYLTAANIDPVSVIACRTSEKDWRKRIRSASLIISDSLTATAIQPDKRSRVFPIIARESVEALIEQ